MVSGEKCMVTCVSLNIVLYGASFVVHSSFGMVRIVTMFWFFFAARRAQYMAFCMFSLLWEWAYPLSSHLCLKAVPFYPNIESLGNGE
jgi:hypothetical protein